MGPLMQYILQALYQMKLAKMHAISSGNACLLGWSGHNAETVPQAIVDPSGSIRTTPSIIMIDMINQAFVAVDIFC